MNNLKKTAIAAVALLAISPLSAQADGSFYVGGSVGSASLTEDFDGFDVDASSTAFRLIAGWQFNEYISAEAGYHQFGAFEQRFDVNGEILNVSLKADGFTLGATGAIPLGERFSLYGRAGSFFWDGDADINNVSQATPEDTNLYIGLGAKFAFNYRWALVADYTNYALEDTDGKVVSLGVTLSF